MNECKTCRHWLYPTNGLYDNIVNPMDQDTFESMEMPFEVRQCMNPDLHFCERPSDIRGYAVADGSDYMAKLYTAEEFGCVLHEAIP